MALILSGTNGITSVNGSASAPSVTGTDTDTGIVYGTNTLSLATGGTTAMTIDSSQNVGIGASSINVANKLEATGDITNTWTGGATRFVGSRFSDGANYELGMKTIMDSRETRIFAKAADTGGYVTIATGITPTERMRIDSSGNVGIGTSSPTSGKLQVVQSSNTAGAIYATAASGQNGNAFLFGVAGVSNGYAIANDGSNNIQHIWSGGGGTERARINGGGLFFINCTSSPTSNATGQLNIIAGVGTDAVNIKHLQNGNNFMNLWQVGSTTCAMMSFKKGDGETGVGSISCSTSSTAYVTSSDYRLKENIAPMTGALDVVAQLKPVTYNWKTDGSDGQGFIAHELQAVVPECVTGEKDEVETYTDEDGVEQTRPKYQGIDTSFLVATLTAAIQEQQAIIEQLKADVAELKAAK